VKVRWVARQQPNNSSWSQRLNNKMFWINGKQSFFWFTLPDICFLLLSCFWVNLFHLQSVEAKLVDLMRVLQVWQQNCQDSACASAHFFCTAAAVSHLVKCQARAQSVFSFKACNKLNIVIITMLQKKASLNDGAETAKKKQGAAWTFATQSLIKPRCQSGKS